MTRLSLVLALLSSLTLAACGGSSAARSTTAASAPEHLDSVQGFTEAAAARFQRYSPDLQMVVAGPLTLRATGPAFEGIQANLDRIWDHCQRVPAECSASLDEYVEMTSRSIAEMRSDQPVTAERLMPVIRPAEYAQAIAAEGGAPGRPLVEGLMVMVVVDSPSSAAALTMADLVTLRMSAEQAHETALTNLARYFDGWEQQVVPLDPGQVGFVPTNDFYTSSLILLDDRWGAISERLGGTLYVAIPGPNRLMYSNHAGEPMRLAFLSIVDAHFQSEQRPLSATVLEWTADGWRAVEHDFTFRHQRVE